jgi:PKHD-type hydroxylase
MGFAPIAPQAKHPAMFNQIPDLLTREQVKTLREIAAKATFVNGRITNPHNKAKNNLQIQQVQDTSAYEQSARLIMQAMSAHEDFRNFTFPAAIMPPMITAYEPGMSYGAHADSALLNLPGQTIRSDVSCTIFLGDPSEYDGGALVVSLGTATLRFKGPAGSAICYPSDTLHEVEPVTRGRRLVAITFIQSRIADPWKRSMLYEVNEVAALEGLGMKPENYTRLNLFQQKLLRHWTDKP